MMVDKTGVGPEGEDVATVTGAEQETSDQEEDPDPSSCAEPDSSPTLEKHEEDASSSEKCPFSRTKSNQRWMKLRTTVQLSGAISSTIQKTKPPLKREDSFLKRFSTRQGPETHETMDTGDDGDGGSGSQSGGADPTRRKKRRRKHKKLPRTVVNPDENFYFYWLMLVAICVLYNLWTLIVRQSFPELQDSAARFWLGCDLFTDTIFVLDVAVQFRTGYLEQGLMVYDSKKLAGHYIKSRAFLLDLVALLPLDLLQLNIGVNPILRFPRFLKVYRVYNYYYMVESRTVYPNLWRVMNLIHILLILAHWFGCFYYLLSEAEGFQGDWVYPYRPGDYATLTRKYLGSLYWSTLTLTTIGDLPTPETNAEYIFTIVSYLIGVFIFATIVGQVGNVITNRNANRLEFERLLDGAKTYMRHHKVPGGMKRRVLRWYDYSWSRGRIQGGGDINTALGLLPDKLKTELALHVNLSVLKKVTIFHECQPEFLHDLVLKMKAYIFTPGDLICRKGEVAREMFIIADGILEVKSENGRVLTTMKAGDFFGEIGILNLDGLNRRTADVRSVGYSELFSLSREDVLTAMKDYPEAQDILQTLGRKRLMEARSSVNRCNKNSGAINKQFVRKIVRAEDFHKHRRCRHNLPLKPDSNLDSVDIPFGTEGTRRVSSPGQSDLFDHKTGKKIVEKICSDVKGLKNVLRKSRRGPRSKDECMELQPLTNSQDGERHYREGKGVLCRMPRVMSDDTSQEDESYTPPQETKIGAGLPLLQRLKLLKEKQDKEAIEEVKASSEKYVQKEEEPEVIGAGLPLLQRLLLLKQKEERDREVNTVQTTANETAQVLASTVRTQFRSPPLSFKSQKCREKSKEEEPTLKSIMLNRVSASKKSKDIAATVAAAKNGGISWKDDYNKQSIEPKPKEEVLSDVNGDLKGDEAKQELNKQLPKVKPQLKLQTLLKQAGLGNKQDKYEVVSSLQKTAKGSTELTKVPDNVNIVGSNVIGNTVKVVSSLYVPDTSESERKIPENCSKTFLETKERVEINKSRLEAMKSHKPLERSCSNIEKSNIPFQKDKIGAVNSNKFAQEPMSAQISSIIKDNNSNISCQRSSNKDSVLIDIDVSSDDQQARLSKISRLRKSPGSLKLRGENKIYKSIEDLSPEYTSLPFVKQLRILNERQKLLEIQEKAVMRSSSLDSGHARNSKELNKMYSSSNLTRSHSEAIAIEVVLRNQYHRAQATGTEISECAQTVSGHSLSPDEHLTSPESNETVERRHLKSILKKLSSTSITSNSDSSESQPIFSNSPAEMRKLMRAQTVEGYAARHSKFTKSVTFNRDTVQSPPSGFNSPITSPNLHFTQTASSLNGPTDDRTRTLPSSDAQHFSQHHPGETVNVGQRPCCVDTSTTPTSTVQSSPVLNAQPSISVTSETISTSLSQISELRTTNCTNSIVQSELKDPRPLESHRKPPGNWIEPPQAKQKNFFRPGSILLPTHASQEEEFFGGILSGIKTIIQNYLEEIHSKFQTRFHDLEMEVKKRDDIIAQLQERIHELEVSITETEKNTEREESSDMDSSDPPFMRGDSVDTIVSSPRRRSLRCHRDRRSWEDHSEEENLELMDLPRSIIPQTVWNSQACVDIESDSSSNKSLSENEDVFSVDEYSDWEVKMLAKELDRRESLQGTQDQVCQLSVRDLPVSVRRRRAVSCDSDHRERKISKRRVGNDEDFESSEKRRPSLNSTLDDRHNVSGGLSALYRRSLSISNLHSTFSNGLFRGLGSFVCGNVPQTYREPSTDMVPTISRSCPPPPPPPLPPDI